MLLLLLDAAAVAVASGAVAVVLLKRVRVAAPPRADEAVTSDRMLCVCNDDKTTQKTVTIPENSRRIFLFSGGFLLVKKKVEKVCGKAGRGIAFCFCRSLLCELSR